MARTALGEARGISQEARQAVMWTGVNRFTAKRWFSGQTIAGTFLKFEQYDCWNWNDKNNYPLICNIATGIELYDDAMYDATLVLAGLIPDLAQGATHYYDTSIPPPAWTANATKTVQIDNLIFYKDVA